MEEMASLWDYEEAYNKNNQQHNEMEQLREKLLFTSLELENIKSEFKEETRKNKEYINQLTHLLKLAIQERNEAINQLQTILNNNTNIQNFPTIPDPTKPGKANSSITESNSYDNYVESLFDAAVLSYPEFTSINHINYGVVPQFDEGSLIIDNVVKGTALPEKGKFLKAVVEAGPLLQTLIVAGSMPRWRNPPQIQTFQIPPVSIRGCDVVGNLGSRSFNTNGYVPLAKTQRFC